MNDPLPPADPPAPSDLPWDALAAGELPPDEAEALRARAATDPSAEAARREAQAVEDALRAEPLLPLPLHLVGRVLAATAQPARIAPRVLLVRVAACVLIAFLAWIAFAGDVPALADMTAHPQLTASLPDVSLSSGERWSPTVVPAAWSPEGETGSPSAVVLLVIGLGLLIVGIVAALRSGPASGDAS